MEADPQPGRSPSASACEPYREIIEGALVQRPQRHGDLAGPGGRPRVLRDDTHSVKRFVRKLRGSPTPEARVVIETAPGEEAQVDYGTGPMVRDPAHRQVPAHAAVRDDAGHSRKSVRLLLFRSSSRIWAELHEKAFRRLGGVDSRGGAR